MKLFLLLRPHQQIYGDSMALRALLFSTQALTRQPSPITPLKRMTMQVRGPASSVVPILENSVQEGNKIEHSQPLKKAMRLSIRSNHALQNGRVTKGYELSAEDIAAQLELTSRVHGIVEAEMYFDTIPNNLRGYEVYCALLSSYAHHRCFIKGVVTMQKIRELGFLRNTSAYNAMLSFYYEMQEYNNRNFLAEDKIREYNKMNILAEEMREEGINKDETTYNLLLKSNSYYLLVKNLGKVLTEMEADPLVNTGWYHYFLAAKGYCVSGEVEKALTMLKKSEKSMDGNLDWSAFEDLITLYGWVGSLDGALVGSKAGLYRLWSLYGPKKEFSYSAYFMIDSLIEMDDPSAAKIWEEWFSKYSRITDEWEREVYFQIPAVLIRLFCMDLGWEKDLGLEMAEAIGFRLRESGIEPDAATLDVLASVYCRCKQMDKAVETLMEAISVSKPGFTIGRMQCRCCLDCEEHC